MLFIVDSNGVPSVAPFVHLPAASEDTQAPTAPSNLTAASPSLGTVTLNWNAATDNVAVTKYNVYRSNVPDFTPTAANRVAQVTGLSFTDTGVPAGTWYYVVTAQDANNNVGPASNTATVTVAADVTAPTVGVTSPTAGTTVSGTINLAASASDDVGVAGVQFYVDGVAFGSPDTAAPYSVSWNSATAANGQHTVTARAYDAAGNTTTSAGVTVTVSNTPVVAGLVAAWGFDDAAGTTASDSSGHNLTGTVSNTAWTTAGKFGGALAFNGTSSWVTVADNNLLDLTTGMTLEAWVKPNSLSGWTNVIMKERGTTGLNYALYASDNTGQPPAGYVYRGSDINAVGTTALAIGAWTHLATTYDGANLRLYVNGALVRTRAVTGTLANTANPLRIGGDLPWGEYFNGLIDEVRVYSRALSLAEIQTDMTTAVNPVVTAAAVMAPALATPTTALSTSTTSATQTTRTPAPKPKRPKTVARPANTVAPVFSARPIVPTTAAVSFDNVARDDANDAPRSVLN
jgi:hypothetical protein